MHKNKTQNSSPWPLAADSDGHWQWHPAAGSGRASLKTVITDHDVIRFKFRAEHHDRKLADAMPAVMGTGYEICSTCENGSSTDEHRDCHGQAPSLQS
eukprot:1684560-Rhodomonas_salina.2